MTAGCPGTLEHWQSSAAHFEPPVVDHLVVDHPHTGSLRLADRGADSDSDSDGVERRKGQHRLLQSNRSTAGYYEVSIQYPRLGPAAASVSAACQCDIPCDIPGSATLPAPAAGAAPPAPVDTGLVRVDARRDGVVKGPRLVPVPAHLLPAARQSESKSPSPSSTHFDHPVAHLDHPVAHFDDTVVDHPSLSAPTLNTPSEWGQVPTPPGWRSRTDLLAASARGEEGAP